MIERGSTLGGYTVVRLLGSGGMGVVYEAVQGSLDRHVALKVLKPDLAGDPVFADRFRREGRLQATIEHPHVLDVYEVGEADPEGLFLAMRLVEGPTLADLLRAGELDTARTLELLGQVGDALDAAHEVGLVHRDIKPQNVLVGDGDHAFLADFGLSRIGTDPATASRPTVGTVAYVAPEVISGEVPGPASDRYAFAATLFHCLTGDVIFPRGSEAAVLFAHAGEAPPRISARRPELPAALDKVFEEALAKEPGRRPGSARDLVTSVRERLEAAGMAELGPPRIGAPSSLTPETLPSSPPPPELAKPPRRRMSALVVVAIALAAAALGAGAVALVSDDDDAEGPPPDVAVPEMPAGALALGSTLDPPDDTVGCRGEAPQPVSESCAIVQADAPDAQLVVPADGVISGWSVRGASGEVALDVIRPRGDDTIRVARSQWETAGNAAPFHFDTNLPVERGDQIGVELGYGSGIGVRDADGATTQRWFDPIGGAYGKPDKGAGTGLDQEILLRADFVPGGEAEKPKSLTGAAAENAPDGLVRKRMIGRIAAPRARVPVELVEVDGQVALDLYNGDRRIQRIFVPDLLPGGNPIAMANYVYPNNEFSEIDIYWVNPSSGHLYFHFFNLSEKQLSFVL